MNERRRRELSRRINNRYIAAPGDREAFATDSLHHASVEQIRRLITATDEAMDLEGVTLGTLSWAKGKP